MVKAEAYVPDRGDVVWISLNPQAGHEQAGRRPALVFSPIVYNDRVGLAILCPITSQIKGYPFEVLIPEGLAARGVILADQVKSVDWRARRAELICTLSPETVAEVLGKLRTLLGEGAQPASGKVAHIVNHYRSEYQSRRVAEKHQSCFFRTGRPAYFRGKSVRTGCNL